MSSPEHDQEDVGATASSSEPDDEHERSVTSPDSDVASATTRSSVEHDEADGSNSSRQSNDSTANDTNEASRSDLIKNLLIKVDKDFNEICLDEDKFHKAAECYLDRVIDFVTLGVAFSVYREIKMGAYTAAVVRMEQLAEDKSNKIRTDIFAEYYDKERKCVCSKCTKMVLASGFAIHLEVCMGIKQSRTRNARRVVTATSSREHDSPTYESLPSSDEDDDDDADWSCGGEKRKKKRDRNGSKRVKGTPTKKTEIESSELMEVEEVDIEGGADEIVYEEEEADDDIFSLSEFFVDDSSQSYATASSAGTHSNTSSDDAETKMEQSSPSPTSSS